MKNKVAIISIISICLITVIALIVINPFGEKNKNIEITVNTNGGVPYKWVYEIEDESIVQYVKNYVVEENTDKNVEGGRVQINYVFKGVKPGNTKVKLKYVSIVDGSVDKEESYNLKVDRRNNVSMVVVAQ